MSFNNGVKFSTKDYNNDGWKCGERYHAGWWYRYKYFHNGFYSCSTAFLNGAYHYRGVRRWAPDDGIYWQGWLGWYYSLKATEMKIRLQ